MRYKTEYLISAHIFDGQRLHLIRFDQQNASLFNLIYAEWNQIVL